MEKALIILGLIMVYIIISVLLMFVIDRLIKNEWYRGMVSGICMITIIDLLTEYYKSLCPIIGTITITQE